MISVYDDWLQPELKNILRDTFFFEDGDFDGIGMIKRVAPKPGKVVIFDRNHVHCSSPPVKAMYRMVMNVCFIAPYELGDMYKYKEVEET